METDNEFIVMSTFSVYNVMLTTVIILVHLLQSLTAKSQS